VSWGPPPDPTDRRPLSGIKVLDLARAIAAPTIGRICSALGATVIRVSSSTNTELPITLIDGCIGKISADINLKTFEGKKKLMELIKDADVFVDGYRPSVLEHLGFGRDAVMGLVANRDKGIVYCQENCYGWKGPWVTRPGWAQIADTVCTNQFFPPRILIDGFQITGIGLGIGRFHGYDEAHIFPGPNADYLYVRHYLGVSPSLPPTVKSAGTNETTTSIELDTPVSPASYTPSSFAAKSAAHTQCNVLLSSQAYR
jgi:hypothetical protein